MKKLKGSEEAVSPVIGVVLMVGLTVVMGSVVAVSVLAFTPPENAPQAKIVMVEAKGDIGDESLYNNTVVLKHKGGDALNKNDTKIIITGRGYAYTGTDPEYTSARDLRVTYRDLTGDNDLYGPNKKIVEGISWDSGETITLYGRDGYSGINTVDSKWKLDDGTTVSVTIIDTTTNQVIAVSHATVKDA